MVPTNLEVFLHGLKLCKESRIIFAVITRDALRGARVLKLARYLRLCLFFLH